jgi:hypothetical protein
MQILLWTIKSLILNRQKWIESIAHESSRAENRWLSPGKFSVQINARDRGGSLAKNLLEEPKQPSDRR